MAIVGKLTDIKKHFKNNEYFQQALLYLEDSLNSETSTAKRIHKLPLNSFEKFEINKNLFAIEQKFYSKERHDCFLESHIKYIDIQLIISGQEQMEFCHIQSCKVDKKYDADNDLITYQDNDETSKALLGPGDCAIYFPQDIHMGCQQYKESKLCTKTVIKMPIDYLA